jgi:hypothetical protein
MARSEPAIHAPEFPAGIDWINAPFVRVSTLLGRNVLLVWFWDFCSLNSLRALPYLNEWHSRYQGAGLRIVGVHSPQFDFGGRREEVESAARRLDIGFPIAVDSAYEIWKLYGTEVWPSLYLWDKSGVLRHHHFGEGAYGDTETAIAQLLKQVDGDLQLPAPLAPMRETDADGALVQVPTPHVYLEEDRSARSVAAGEQLELSYEGAAATAILDGEGVVDVYVDGELRTSIELVGPRLYQLVETPAHEAHELKLLFRAPARAYAFSFAPGPA